MNNWKQELIQVWDELQVYEFLSSIDVDYEKNFLESITSFQGENPYPNYIWQMLPHPQIPSGVLHAYPATMSNKNKVWEEWFSLDQKIHHHVLSQVKLEQSEGTWLAAADDRDHPIEVLGINWNYHNDLDHRPFYLR